MAEGPLDLLQQLQAQIDGYVGMAGLREGSADLWLRIHGPGIELDDAPTSPITTLVDALRKGVQTHAQARALLRAQPTQAAGKRGYCSAASCGPSRLHHRPRIGC